MNIEEKKQKADEVIEELQKQLTHLTADEVDQILEDINWKGLDAENAMEKEDEDTEYRIDTPESWDEFLKNKFKL
jgi:phage terminase Nu1 subunit (DNA packaging protein)